MTSTIDPELQNVAQRFPIGRAVRFYPVAGEPTAEVTKIRSEPWRLGHGQIVIKVEGRAGGVHVGHLDLVPPGALDRPIKAGRHCRHYSYDQAGPGKSGPRCALGQMAAEPGSSSPCMPAPRTGCDFRQEYTDTERADWKAWVEDCVIRLAEAVSALPKPIPLNTSGAVVCPSCGQELRYSRWHRGAMIACATHFCVEARFSIEAGADWPAAQPELIP